MGKVFHFNIYFNCRSILERSKFASFSIQAFPGWSVQSCAKPGNPFSENHFAVKLCSHKKMMLVLVQLRYLTLTSFRSPSLSFFSLFAYGAREVILNARH